MGPGEAETGSSAEDRNPETRIDLGPTLNISLARELHHRLRQALDAGGDVVLDAAGVERLDTAAAQLLVAFGIELEGRGRRFRIERPSPSFTRVVSLLGVWSHLGGAGD